MNIGNLFALNGKIETEVLSVCCVQFAPIGAQTVEELDENTQTMLDYLDLAVSAFPGVDLVVFPEACFQGFAPVNCEDALMTEESEQLARVRERCKKLSVWSVIDPLIRSKTGKCFENTAMVIDDRGARGGISRGECHRAANALYGPVVPGLGTDQPCQRLL